MKVIKKINNNVSVCKDGNGDELIAFGKGIGFPKTPYELTDMTKIQMTFYRMDSQFYRILKEIPEDIIEVSTEIVTKAQMILDKPFSPNIVFSLADHINFAIIRSSDYKEMKLPLDYEIKVIYPREFQLGKFALKLIDDKLDIQLPSAEALAIAMHLVNAQKDGFYEVTDDLFNNLVSKIVSIINQSFNIEIDEESFSFSRFLTHLRYYLKRLSSNQIISNEVTPELISTFREGSPLVYKCTQKIVSLIDSELRKTTSKDEMFYLMIYVNRISKKIN